MRSGRIALLAALAASAAGCATDPQPHHRDLTEVWQRYRSLPEPRALALAGDVRREWVAGAAGGRGSPEQVEAAALRDCEERRHRQRILEPCRLYAVGDEIVWPVR